MLLNCGVGEDLRVPWTARRSNQSILKEIGPEYSLEGLMLKLKLQYFAHLMPTHWKRHWCCERLRAGGEGATEDEMVGWHHRLNEHEFEQTAGDGEVQGSLVGCSPWDHRVGQNWVTFSLSLSHTHTHSVCYSKCYGKPLKYFILGTRALGKDPSLEIHTWGSSAYG